MCVFALFLSVSIYLYVDYCYTVHTMVMRLVPFIHRVKSVYSLRISLVSVDRQYVCVYTFGCVSTSDERDERTICVVVMLSELNCTELVTSTHNYKAQPKNLTF